MIIRNDFEQAAAKQLAADLCCLPEDFFVYKNAVTLPGMREGRRKFSGSPHFFRAATMGMGAVICADEAVTDYSRLLCSEKTGAEIFSAATLAGLNNELRRHGCCIGVINEYFLPKSTSRPAVPHQGFDIRVFEGSDIELLYRWEGFDNALLHRTIGERYDILAVCAISGNVIMGIAGASRDSETMAQIGIDVLEQYRGMGIGSALASICASEVMGMGMVPYYGTWMGNVISRRLALHCGFYPAWCEMFSLQITD